MKRLFTLSLAVVIACTTAFAQRADIKKAAQRYKNVASLTASVSMTRHNAAITQDTKAEGTLYYKKPDTESMVFKKQKEMLLASGTKYVMVKNGKQRTAKPGSGNPFEVIKEVFGNIISADDNATLSKTADVKMARHGNTCTVTITPKAAKNGKKTRRQMYTSCVATIDLKAGELRSLRINERAGNYTQYDFSAYKLNAKVDDTAFSVKAVL